MCRYIVIKGGDTVLSAEHDFNAACKFAEDHVKAHNGPVEVFERVTTANPTIAVQWEGRKRPGVA